MTVTRREEHGAGGLPSDGVDGRLGRAGGGAGHTRRRVQQGGEGGSIRPPRGRKGALPTNLPALFPHASAMLRTARVADGLVGLVLLHRLLQPLLQRC
jgi:hypothetical protein